MPVVSRHPISNDGEDGTRPTAGASNWPDTGADRYEQFLISERHASGQLWYLTISVVCGGGHLLISASAGATHPLATLACSNMVLHDVISIPGKIFLLADAWLRLQGPWASA